MSRTSTGCWKTQGLTETKVAKKCLAGTLLFLLGVLAQLTGEAGGLHQTSNGHHQVRTTARDPLGGAKELVSWAIAAFTNEGCQLQHHSFTLPSNVMCLLGRG